MSYDYYKNIPPDEDDPYERGFAHKLYENDIPEPPRTQFSYPIRQNQTPTLPPRKPKKKKQRIGLKIFFVLLAFLILTIGIGAACLHFLPKAPTADSRDRKYGFCTILLAGTDESGDRTDTIMLLSIDRENEQISLMSIPRDTRVDCSYWPEKINAAYGMNGHGEEGMEALMEYVSECVGFMPDGYLLLELDVFIDLVDLFGGVEFDVPMDMYYEDPGQDLYINLEEGCQILDGEAAMGLVRYRYGYADADIGRVSVQRDFMMAAIRQWANPKNVFKLKEALSLLEENSTTDLSKRNMLWLAESLLICGTDDMYMTTIPYYFSDIYVIIDDDEDYLSCINDYFNPYKTEITQEDLNIAK